MSRKGACFKRHPVLAQPELLLYYKGTRLRQTYKPDLICFERVIVELKAVKAIAPEHKAQVLNYLKATNLRPGLLVNFGSHPMAQIERLIL